MSNTRELELKFEVAPDKAESLKTRGLRRLGGEGIRERLSSVYFDTRKHALNKKGLTLRIRAAGEHRVQTIKGRDGSGAGLFDRSEWESQIAGDVPDLLAAAKTPLADVMAGKRGDDLLPIFATEVDRTVWTVSTGQSEIEVALDEGRIETSHAARPIAELELELKRGSPADLFALARSIDSGGWLRVGVLSKSERGYRLASQDAASSYKAEPLALRRQTASADAVAAIMRACLRHFRLNEPLVVETRSAEALHQARVALRRLRSALSLFKPILSDSEYEGIRRRLKSVSGLLGDARNIDVFLERSSGAAGQQGAAASSAGEAEADTTHRLQAERERAYDRVIATLEGRRFRRLMLDLLAWIENGSWRLASDKKARSRLEEPVELMAARLLTKRRRRMKKDGRDLASLTPDARHEVRIEAKKLRYASEFFGGLVETRKERRRHKEFVDALQGLQGCLGDLNDLYTARSLAASLALGSEAVQPDSVDAGHSSEGAGPATDGDAEAELVECAVEAHRALCKAKPFWRSFD